jgi:hypothetical protein
MSQQQARTFRQILEDVSADNAQRLETKARQASWLAKIHQPQPAKLYEIKHDALRQLFRIPNHMPVIRDAWISARGYLLSVWLNRSLAPRSRGTDILGAILLTTEIFKENRSAPHDILVIYSDMQNVSRELNLEYSNRSKPQTESYWASPRELPTMTGASVYVLGASTTRVVPQEWVRVRNFWLTYFARAGATVGVYSSRVETLKLTQ